MPRALLLSVHFHDGRYHGRPEWPPSPARLFQALVAGTAQGGMLPPDDRDALGWLECLAPPIIAAPAVRSGNGYRNYVPNNDLDAVGGDPRRVAEIRAPKFIKPLLFDAEIPLIYAWQFERGQDYARRVCNIVERLYQLGRGVDMAWGWGEIIDVADLEARLHQCRGVLHRPANRGEGRSLACPHGGSLNSLEVRFGKAARRFATIKMGGKTQQLFSQAPKPRFAAVDYDSPPQRLLFELRQAAQQSQFARWPLTNITKLVETVRDRAKGKLTLASSDRAAMIERVFVCRDATEADKAARIRIIPLPSIGSIHVVRSIRRILVEVPPNCPLSAEDVAWSFSGLDLNVDYLTGEILGDDKPVLVPTDDRSMLLNYGLDGRRSEGYRVWRTVTPAALPQSAARRRIDPGRLQQELTTAGNVAATEFREAKLGRERLTEEARAASAVFQALRHVGLSTDVQSLRVQREPFEGRGARAEAFAPGTRFAKERLRHVEIVFAEPQHGPLAIGDSRYLGLGLMAPVRGAWRDVMVFGLPGDANIEFKDAPGLLHAVRRALMALSREFAGQVTRLFSGHEESGAPAASGKHEHIFLAADDSDGDGLIERFFVAAPWVCDRSMKPLPTMRKAFDEVVSRLAIVRAGRLGVIPLGRPLSFGDNDPLIGPARVWESQTSYRATRHAGRHKDAAAALMRDVIAECARRNLPQPKIELREFSALPNGGGLTARMRLRFTAPIGGPLLLGRDSHKGGGLFSAYA